MTLNVVSWLMVAALATPAPASKAPAAARVPASTPAPSTATKTATKTATLRTAPAPTTTSTTATTKPESAKAAAPVATVAPTSDPTLEPGESCPEPDPTAEDADVAENDGHADPAHADDGEDGEEVEAVDPESENHALPPVDNGNLYTSDLSDAQLKEMWAKDPSSLGSISIGFTDAGRLVNGVQFPTTGGNWIVVDPNDTWGTKETVDFIAAAINEVDERFPNTPAIRVNDISRKEGGHLRPHRSHESGRDVDIGFYYPTVDPVRVREREKHIDVARNWALVRALITNTDVQFILVDKRVQKVLRAHAESIGEDRDWLTSVFNGPEPLIRHARHHRDHFHVRFFNARAQELGRRVQPLLSLVPEQNLTTHRVRRGDTLGHIARRYGTTVAQLKKRNGLKSNNLRVGRTLTIPLRGPCTQCPVPPPLVVPPRRLPPVEVVASLSQGPDLAATKHE